MIGDYMKVRIRTEPIEAFTFSQFGKKKKESAELAAQIAEWESQGGKINCLSINQAAIDAAEMALLVNEFGGYDIDRSKKIANQRKSAEIFYSGSNRSKSKSPHGQNIKKLKNGKFKVSISNMHKTFDTEEEAREWRDNHRETLGLPPAEY